MIKRRLASVFLLLGLAIDSPQDLFLNVPTGQFEPKLLLRHALDLLDLEVRKSNTTIPVKLLRPDELQHLFLFEVVKDPSLAITALHPVLVEQLDPLGVERS